MELPPEVVAVLRAAVDLMGRHRGDRFEQFDAVRAAMSRITRVDAFYIAEFVGDDAVHFHHQYDEGFFALPGSHPVKPGRTAHWVRTHRRTYRYAEDDGAALQASVPFGQVEKVSHDALVTPVFDDTADRRITGLISVQTYEPGTYDDSTVAALEYLADSLGAQLAYEERAADRARRLGDDPYSASLLKPSADMLSGVIVSLGELYGKFDRIMAAAESVEETERLRTLRRDIERLLSELWRRELQFQKTVADRLDTLTARQRELALLLIRPSPDGETGPTTAELAAWMGISEVTVKSHMNVILRVFDATHRSEVAAVVRRLTTMRPH